MTADPEGAKTHLDYWLYGIVKTASQLGNVRLFLRAVQEESIRKFLKDNPIPFQEETDPVQILRAYNERLDRQGVLDAGSLQYEPDRDGFLVSVGSTCPYRSTCTWIHDERGTLACFRAIAMGEVLRIVAHRTYEGALDRFGDPCRLSFKLTHMEVSDDGD